MLKISVYNVIVDGDYIFDLPFKLAAPQKWRFCGEASECRVQSEPRRFMDSIHIHVVEKGMDIFLEIVGKTADLMVLNCDWHMNAAWNGFQVTSR